MKDQKVRHGNLEPSLLTNSPIYVRSSRFKYYIHDSVDACRLQLIGSLTAADVSELDGCWNTAKITLKERKLVVDLTCLQSIDDAGRQWVARMVAEGAAVKEHSAAAIPPAPRPGLMRRLYYALSGVTANFPTQAQ